MPSMFTRSSRNDVQPACTRTGRHSRGFGRKKRELV